MGGDGNIGEYCVMMVVECTVLVARWRGRGGASGNYISAILTDSQRFTDGSAMVTINPIFSDASAIYSD